MLSLLRVKMAEISFNVADVEFEFKDESQIRQWLNKTISSENKEVRSLDYILVSDSYLIEMNQKYLEHDTFTDIITFNLSDDNVQEGEIYISLERVRENALKFNVTVQKELLRVMVHGLLHLLGYNDHSEDEKLEMRSKENRYLSHYV